MRFHFNTKQRVGEKTVLPPEPWPGVGVLLRLNATPHIQSFSSESGPEEASENSLQPGPGRREAFSKGQGSLQRPPRPTQGPAPHRRRGFFYRAVSRVSLRPAAGSNGVLRALTDSAVWMSGQPAVMEAKHATLHSLCAA